MNWFVLVLRIGVDIDVAIHVQPLPNARPAPPEWRRLDAYYESQADIGYDGRHFRDAP
jgi:hypothetical protein